MLGKQIYLNDKELECLVLKNNQPEIIAEKILEIGDHDEKWKKNISLQCKEISSKYNKESQSKEFKRVFEELIEKI